MAYGPRAIAPIRQHGADAGPSQRPPERQQGRGIDLRKAITRHRAKIEDAERGIKLPDPRRWRPLKCFRRRSFWGVGYNRRDAASGCSFGIRKSFFRVCTRRSGYRTTHCKRSREPRVPVRYGDLPIGHAAGGGA